MTHVGTKLIETPRLLLRQFTLEDAPAAFRNWCGDSLVTRFLRWPTHSSDEVTRGVLEGWVRSYEKEDCYHWAIELKELGEPIGSIGSVGQNERLRSFEIGYCIGSRWWRQGIVSEALAALLPFFFDEVRANRIEAHHDPNNPNSGKVMVKCGLLYEGTRRQADWSNSGTVDSATYAILAEDYHREGP